MCEDSDLFTDLAFLYINEQGTPVPIKTQECLSDGRYDSVIGFIIIVVSVLFIGGLLR